MPFDQHEFDMLCQNFFGLKQSNINMEKIAAVKNRMGQNGGPERPSDRLTRAAG